MPASTPVVLFIVPTAVLLLLQVPPVVVAPSVVLFPAQMNVVPVIDSVEFTVTTVVAKHPLVDV